VRILKFYNVKTRESVEVPDDKVTLVTMKNGKKAAKAEINGTKLFKNCQQRRRCKACIKVIWPVWLALATYAQC